MRHISRLGASSLALIVMAALFGIPGSVTAASADEQLDQTITFEPIGDRTVGEPDIEVSATASSGLGVDLTASPANVCVVALGRIHIAKKGTCKVTASQPGNGSYRAADPVQQSFTVVTRAKLVVKSVKPKYKIKPGGTLKPTVRVTAAGRKPSGTLTYYIDGELVASDTYAMGAKSIMSLVTAPATPGKHVLRAVFTDDAGSHQRSTCRDRTFKVKTAG